MARNAEAHLVLPILAVVVATAAALSRDPSSPTGCQLWAHTANEETIPESNRAYTTLRQFAGVPISYEPNRISVQSYTLGKTAAEALAQSALVINTLVDDDGFPQRGWLIGTVPNQYIVDVFTLMEGGLIGVDPRGRFEAVFNFELAYRKVAS